MWSSVIFISFIIVSVSGYKLGNEESTRNEAETDHRGKPRTLQIIRPIGDKSSSQFKLTLDFEHHLLSSGIFENSLRNYLGVNDSINLISQFNTDPLASLKALEISLGIQASKLSTHEKQQLKLTLKNTLDNCSDVENFVQNFKTSNKEQSLNEQVAVVKGVQFFLCELTKQNKDFDTMKEIELIFAQIDDPNRPTIGYESWDTSEQDSLGRVKLSHDFGENLLSIGIFAKALRTYLRLNNSVDLNSKLNVNPLDTLKALEIALGIEVANLSVDEKQKLKLALMNTLGSCTDIESFVENFKNHGDSLPHQAAIVKGIQFFLCKLSKIKKDFDIEKEIELIITDIDDPNKITGFQLGTFSNIELENFISKLKMDPLAALKFFEYSIGIQAAKLSADEIEKLKVSLKHTLSHCSDVENFVKIYKALSNKQTIHQHMEVAKVIYFILCELSKTKRDFDIEKEIDLIFSRIHIPNKIIVGSKFGTTSDTDESSLGSLKPSHDFGQILVSNAIFSNAFKNYLGLDNSINLNLQLNMQPLASLKALQLLLGIQASKLSFDEKENLKLTLKNTLDSCSDVENFVQNYKSSNKEQSLNELVAVVKGIQFFLCELSKNKKDFDTKEEIELIFAQIDDPNRPTIGYESWGTSKQDSLGRVKLSHDFGENLLSIGIFAKALRTYLRLNNSVDLNSKLNVNPLDTLKALEIALEIQIANLSVDEKQKLKVALMNTLSSCTDLESFVENFKNHGDSLPHQAAIVKGIQFFLCKLSKIKKDFDIEKEIELIITDIDDPNKITGFQLGTSSNIELENFLSKLKMDPLAALKFFEYSIGIQAAKLSADEIEKLKVSLKHTLSHCSDVENFVKIYKASSNKQTLHQHSEIAKVIFFVLCELSRTKKDFDIEKEIDLIFSRINVPNKIIVGSKFGTISETDESSLGPLKISHDFGQILVSNVIFSNAFKNYLGLDNSINLNAKLNMHPLASLKALEIVLGLHASKLSTHEKEQLKWTLKNTLASCSDVDNYVRNYRTSIKEQSLGEQIAVVKGIQYILCELSKKKKDFHTEKEIDFIFAQIDKLNGIKVGCDCKNNAHKTAVKASVRKTRSTQGLSSDFKAKLLSVDYVAEAFRKFLGPLISDPNNIAQNLDQDPVATLKALEFSLGLTVDKLSSEDKTNIKLSLTNTLTHCSEIEDFVENYKASQDILPVTAIVTGSQYYLCQLSKTWSDAELDKEINSTSSIIDRGYPTQIEPGSLTGNGLTTSRPISNNISAPGSTSRPLNTYQVGNGTNLRPEKPTVKPLGPYQGGTGFTTETIMLTSRQGENAGKAPDAEHGAVFGINVGGGISLYEWPFRIPFG